MSLTDVLKIVEWFIALGTRGIALIITGLIAGYLLSCRRIKQLKEERRELREEVDRLRNERNELRTDLKRSEDEAEELRNEVERLEERMKKLAKKVRSLEEYMVINISQKRLPPPELPPIRPEPAIEEQSPTLPPTQHLHPVTSKDEIAANVTTFEGYCNEKSTECHSFADEKMKFGKCFVAKQKNGQWIFAPSKFAGYGSNSKELYEANIENIDGRETNFAITKVLDVPCEPETSLNEAFQNYCRSKGISVSEKQRKFWRI